MRISSLFLFVVLALFTGLVACGDDEGESTCTDGESCTCSDGSSGQVTCTDGGAECQCPGDLTDMSDAIDMDEDATDMGGDASDTGDEVDDQSDTTDAGFDIDLDAVDCTDPASWPAGWIAREQAALAAIAMVRMEGATCSGTSLDPVGDLSESAALQEASRCHALDMATNDYLAFEGLDGSSPQDRADAAGFTGNIVQGNLGAGQSTGEEMVSRWTDSEGTCENLMRPEATHQGVGYAADPSSSFTHYWVVQFGRE